MAKATKNKPTVEKQPKTIKVSTVVVSALVLLGLIAAFIGGNVYANNYNSTVEAKAVELQKKLSQ